MAHVHADAHTNRITARVCQCVRGPRRPNKNVNERHKWKENTQRACRDEIQVESIRLLLYPAIHEVADRGFDAQPHRLCFSTPYGTIERVKHYG